MSNVNSVVISGNLTRDPEVRSFGDDGKVANLGVAVNRSFKKADEFVEEVSFFEVTVWGGFADLTGRKLRKGDSVTVQGRLKQDTWTTNEDEKRSKVVIIADQIDSDGYFRPKDEDRDYSADTPAAAAAPKPTAQAPVDTTAGDDEIPF